MPLGCSEFGVTTNLTLKHKLRRTISAPSPLPAISTGALKALADVFAHALVLTRVWYAVVDVRFCQSSVHTDNIIKTKRTPHRCIGHVIQRKNSAHSLV